MPTYVYEAAEGEKGCPTCHSGFEVQHGIRETPPQECPRCGGKVVRRFMAPGLVTRWNEKRIMSADNLKRHGFKTLHNEGDGKFRVT